MIQWNMSSIATWHRFDEIQRLVLDYFPMCLWLQHIGLVIDYVVDNYVAAESLEIGSHL